MVLSAPAQPIPFQTIYHILLHYISLQIIRFVKYNQKIHRNVHNVLIVPFFRIYAIKFRSGSDPLEI